MLKIMLVDDETLERQALRLIVETYRPEYRIVSEAADGWMAIEKAKASKPDVVLQDIRLPELDGLQVAAKLRHLQPDCKVIIITAYGEFDYAKEAVALGISDYLLKPVDTQEVIALLDRLAEEIAEAKSAKNEIERLRATLNDVLPLILAGFVMDLINGNIVDAEELKIRAHFLGIKNIPRAALHIRADKPAGAAYSELEWQVVQKQIGELIKAALLPCPDSLAVPVGNGKFAVLLSVAEAADDQEVRQISQLVAENIRQIVLQKTAISVTVGVGRPATGPQGLACSYYDAVTAAEFRLLYGSNQSIVAEDIIMYADLDLIQRKRTNQDLMQAVRMGDWELAKNQLQSLWAEAGFDHNHLVQDFKIQLLEVITQVSRAAVEGGLEPDQVATLSLAASLQIVNNDFIEPKSLSNIHETVCAWLEGLVKQVGITREKRNYKLIEAAVCFLEENCHQDLSLEEVAKHVFLSPCYFSRVFKQVKGYNFSEYLTRMRIAKAKALLVDTTYLISEIAERVGYKDVRYFGQVFKKIAGCTPLNYRRSAAINRS